MKISLKQVLAVGALAVASTSAFADIALPNTNNGELSLIVIDKTSNVAYVRGLQINMDQIATESAIIGDGAYAVGSTKFNLPSTLNVGPDANLTTFLSNAAGHVVTWGVIGGAYDTQIGNIVADARYVSTTLMDAATVSTSTLNSNNSKFKNVNAWDGTFNGAIQGSAIGDGSSTLNSGLTSTTLAAVPTWAGTWTGVKVNQIALGSAANFYLLANSGDPLGDGGSGNSVLVYQLAGLTLSSNGTLTSDTVAPATPIPAAIWLLGSGLAGLVGIGRRKQVA